MAFGIGSTVASLTVKIGADMSELRRAAKDVDRALKPMRDNLRSIGSSMTKFVTLPLAGLGIASLKTAADFEKLQKGLEVLMGSAEAAEKEFNLLKEAAQRPGLGLEQALSGSVNLQAVGFSAEFARDALSEFGNALALSGGGADDLKEVIRQLSQIQSLGKITAENFNVIRERVPLVGRAMQDAFGTTSVEAVRAAGVSTDEFIRGVVDGLSRLERAQGGLANTFENAQIAIQSSLAEIGFAINEAFDIQAIVDTVTGALTAVVEAFRALDAEHQKAILAFAALAAAAGPVALAMSFILTPIGLVAAAVVSLAGVATLFYVKWQDIWTAAESIVFASVRPMLKAIQSLAIGMSAIGLLSADAAAGAVVALQDLQDAWRDSLGSRSIGTDALDDALAKFNDLKAQGRAALASLSGGIQDMTTGTGNAAKSLTEELNKVPILGPDSEGIFTRAQEGLWGMEVALRGVKEVAAQTGPEIAKLTAQITGGVSNAIGELTFAIGNVATGFESLGDAVKRVMRNIVADIVSAIAKALFLKSILAIGQAIPVTAFGGWGGLIGSALSTVGLGGSPMSVSPGSVSMPRAESMNITLNIDGRPVPATVERWERSFNRLGV